MKINKFAIFREMLDYMAHISDVTDADMNAYLIGDEGIKITGETDDEIVTLVVTTHKKEVEEDA